MANEENLKKGEATQFSKESGERAARITKKGGIASNKFCKDLLTSQICLFQAIGTADFDLSDVHKRLKAFEFIDERIKSLERLKDDIVFYKL